MQYNDIKGIIFDYGGTIDSHGDHWSHVIAAGYAHAGLTLSQVDFRDAYVHAERHLAKVYTIKPNDHFGVLMNKKIGIELAYLAEKGVITSAERIELTPVIAEYCYEQARRAVDEARPVLERLAAHLPMVLVSNFYGNVDAVLRDMGIRQYFVGVIESAVVGVRKPDPRIFALGVTVLDMPAHNVLVVGDSLRKDIEPARSLGCQTAWIKGRGWTPDEDAATDPAQIPSLQALPSLLAL